MDGSAAAAAAAFLPVLVQDTDASPLVTPSASASERDPLYAALLGSNIGSSLGGGAEREEELHTLDESFGETLVAATRVRRRSPSRRDGTDGPWRKRPWQC